MAHMSMVSFDSLNIEGIERNPDLELAQMKFKLSMPEYQNNEDLKKEFLENIINNEMAPWYERVCKELHWEVEKSLLLQLQSQNEEKLKEIDNEIVSAEKYLTDVEKHDIIMKKAKYLARIGDETRVLECLQSAYHKSIPITQRIEILLDCIRIGLFFMNHREIAKNLELAEKLIEEGGNWDLRNKLKVYKALYMIAIRRFEEASMLALDATSTFMSPEIIDFNKFVKYTVLASLVVLPRNELKEKIVRNPEIAATLHEDKKLKHYIISLYDCHYAEFFLQLADIEQDIKADYLLNPHYRYYIREMKIKAYSQLLESYNSLSLDFMAQQFGVTADYIDEDLSKHIASGRLGYKIDKVAGIVETGRVHSNSSNFKLVIRQGDLLLNRIQKLSRVINI